MARALITRRRLLGAGLAAGALAVCAGTVRLGSPSPDLRVLSRDERLLVDALGEALWPEGNPIGIPWVGAEHVDEVLAVTLLPVSVLAFRYALRGLAWGSLLTGRSISARSALERVELLHAWSEGPLPERLSHDGIKVVLGMAYFNHPSVMEALGVNFRCSVSSP